MRIRGTALVLSNEKILLVLDMDAHKFSLPGGGANPNEPSMAAAIRELFEELGMEAISAERLINCDYRGSVNHHHVEMIQSSDEPCCNPKEIAELHWWDGHRNLPRQPHVDAILDRWHRHTQVQK
jgi:8-oxo-dGTP pyrophosphatase MutT (NUDIX family)